MQIVIDLPEEEYNLIKMKLESNIGGVSSEAERVIAKGTPLPKHGRLIDADSMKRIDAIQRGDFNSIESIRAWIDVMSTVIEADKSESER